MKKKTASFLLKNISRRGLRREREALIVVDVGDFERVQEYPWFLKYDWDDRLQYVYTYAWGGRGKTRTLKLARFIYGEGNIPPRHDVGHKDGNPANNQRKNLILFKTYNKQRVYYRG